MNPCVSAMSSHGRMAMPTRDAITPPVAKLMCCGARFTSAFATGTTLAAMLVLRVASIRPVVTCQANEPYWRRSCAVTAVHRRQPAPNIKHTIDGQRRAIEDVPIRASKTGRKPSSRPMSSMGSLMTVPKMGTVALVTARPTNVFGDAWIGVAAVQKCAREAARGVWSITRATTSLL